MVSPTFISNLQSRGGQDIKVEKKKPRSIKQKWIVLIFSIHKNFYRSLFFVFDSFECLKQLIWNNRPIYPLIVHPWKPKATSPHRKNELLCANPLCKDQIGQLSSSQGISYGKPSGAAHSTSRVSMSFSCEASCGLVLILHFLRCTTFLNNNAKNHQKSSLLNTVETAVIWGEGYLVRGIPQRKDKINIG